MSTTARSNPRLFEIIRVLVVCCGQTLIKGQVAFDLAFSFSTRRSIREWWIDRSAGDVKAKPGSGLI